MGDETRYYALPAQTQYPGYMYPQQMPMMQMPIMQQQQQPQAQMQPQMFAYASPMGGEGDEFPVPQQQMRGEKSPPGIIQTAYLTPNAAPRGYMAKHSHNRNHRQSSENTNLQNLTVDVDVGARRDGQFHNSDMNVLMMLAANANQKQQCEQSGYASGKGWLYALVIIILIVIVVWIVIALCCRNKRRGKNCKSCGESSDKCTCRQQSCQQSRPRRQRRRDTSNCDNDNNDDDCNDNGNNNNSDNNGGGDNDNQSENDDSHDETRED